MSFALFLCLHDSYHLLPKESLWPLVHCLLGRVGSITARVATEPPSGPPPAVPSPWGRSQPGEGDVHTQRPRIISPTPPTLDPGISFQGCLSFFPRAILPRTDCISKVHALQPQRGPRAGGQS